MKTKKNDLTQWKKRLICMRFIYSALVLKISKNDGINKFKDEILPMSIQEVNKIIAVYFMKKDDIIKLIESKLINSWTIDRINLVDLSIIISSICERIALKTDRKVIIDQAIITSKKYSEKNSYKFINSILDKILK